MVFEQAHARRYIRSHCSLLFQSLFEFAMLFKFQRCHCYALLTFVILEREREKKQRVCFELQLYSVFSFWLVLFFYEMAFSVHCYHHIWVWWRECRFPIQKKTNVGLTQRYSDWGRKCNFDHHKLTKTNKHTQHQTQSENRTIYVVPRKRINCHVEAAQTGSSLNDDLVDWPIRIWNENAQCTQSNVSGDC